jgi:integrase
MNWHQSRSDDFRSPIVRGMGRSKPSERVRDRVLSDDEPSSLEVRGSLYGHRRAVHPIPVADSLSAPEAAQMALEELEGAVWTLPGLRSKIKREQMFPLSPAAMAALDRLPKIAGSTYVFSTAGGKALSDYSRSKRDFDEVCGVTGWRFHDLRRTARSLMS